MKTRSKVSMTLQKSPLCMKQLGKIFKMIQEADLISIRIEEEREVKGQKEFSTGKRKIIFDIYTESKDER